MTEAIDEKVKCSDCGAMILPMTFERTGGLCMPCWQAGPTEPPGDGADEEEEHRGKRPREHFPGFRRTSFFWNNQQYEQILEIVEPLLREKLPKWEEAFPYAYACYHMLDRHEELLELFANAPTYDYGNMMYRAARAMYLTGRFEEAGRTLIREFDSTGWGPGDFYETARPPTNIWSGNLRHLVADAMAQGVLPSAVCEYLLPVLTGARSVVGAFGDEFGIDVRDVNELEYLADWLYKMFEIRLYPFRFAMIGPKEIDVLFKIYLYREPGRIFKMKRMEEAYRELLNKGLLVDAERQLCADEGGLLGYPSCCVKRFVEHRFSVPSEPYEKRASRDQLLWHLDHRRQLPDSLMAYEFYPCSPECTSAVEETTNHRGLYEAFDPDAGELLDKFLLRFRFDQVSKWSGFDQAAAREDQSRRICYGLEIDWPGVDAVHQTLNKRARW